MCLQAAAAARAAAERARLEEAALPLMLDAMWAANICDIELTVRHVCQRVRRCCHPSHATPKLPPRVALDSNQCKLCVCACGCTG